MIESTRPMRDGKLPFVLGYVGISADYPSMTNMEIVPGTIGHIVDGYGPMDMSGTATRSGYAIVDYAGYTSRTVYSGLYDYEVFFTPQFGAVVFQDDVINKKWTGVTFTLDGPATQTINLGTPVPYDQTFTYTFTSANDPTYGSGSFSPPSQDTQSVDGTEYLSVGVYGGGSTVVITNAGSPITSWFITAVSPPP
jgi:hypothetical protein